MIRTLSLVVATAAWMAGAGTVAVADNPLREAGAAEEGAAEPAAESSPAEPAAADKADAEVAAAPEIVELTPPVVQARRQQIEEATALSDVVRVEALKLYDQALQELSLRASFDAKAAQFDANTKSVAADRQTNADALKNLPSDPEVGFLDDKTVPELDQLLRRKEEERDAARKMVEELEAENARRADRRQELLKLIEAAKARLADIEQKLLVPAPADQPAELQTARRTVLLTQRQSAQAEIAASDKEIASYEARVEVLPLRRRLAERRFALSEKAVDKVRRVFAQKRLLDVQLQLTEAQSQVGGVAEELRGVAEENVELARNRVVLDEELRLADAAFDKAQQSLEKYKSQFERTRLKVDKVGLTGAMGLLLRKQKADLEKDIDLARLRRDAAVRQEQLRGANHELLNIEDQRSELGRFDLEVRETLTDVPLRRRTALELESEAEQLLTVKRDFLDALIADYNAYVDQLVDLDASQRELIQLTEQYHNYIEERVLWIRSNNAIGLAAPADVLEDVRALADAGFWRATGSAAVADIRRNPQYLVLGLLIFIPLLVYQSTFRRRLATLGHMAEQRNCRRFDPTVRALLWTAAIAATWPALLAFLGWRLSVLWADFEEALPMGLASGLMAAAYVLFPLEFLRQVCRWGGLARSHFDWPEAGVEALRRNLKWLIWLGLPLTAMAASLDIAHMLGRVAFILSALLGAFFLHCVLKPSGGAMRHFLAYAREGWLYRLRHVTYAAGVIGPLALATLSAVGYYYTAQQLALRMHETALLLIGVLIVRALTLRWLLLTRRRAAMEQAQRRRAAQLAAPAGEASAIINAPPPEEPGPDLAVLNTQANRLLSGAVTVLALAGLWWVWIGVLPALGMLREVELWRTAVETVESSVAADGEVISRTTSTFRYITLADVALAVLAVVLAIVGGKNAPGFLDLAILHRLPMDGGLRYAIATLTRYAITVVGMIAAFALVGIGWSKVQWLVAAVGVGLGFGLQEIFANFVSGLIILMERPIRVGDLVTIGETNGRVSRIQIRATTITDFDNKELVVPNREFITGRVLNWTLSDPVNRLTINVGIAYGSDVGRARELVLAAAQEHPDVLGEPTPVVTFNAFGDSALNLMLFAWLPNLDNRLKVINDLHTEINVRLSEAGIVIAFPQRDLHLHSPEPLQVRVVADARDGASSLSLRPEKKAV
ncbi:MAG: mechanosensitive ion channel [Planctomycetes bacterium]|nr:mechanosensitive ion channel [Planctomycetota bacterium]